MTHTRLTLSIFCLVCTVIVTSVTAEEQWKLPNLNPFNKSEKPARGADQGGSKIPTLDLSSGFGAPTRKRSSEPSTWTKVTQGTKSFFSKSYDVLTPWDTKAEKARAQRARSPLQFSNTGRQKKEKKSFLTSWLPEKEEERRQPQTVSEWLAQPRP